MCIKTNRYNMAGPISNCFRLYEYITILAKLASLHRGLICIHASIYSIFEKRCSFSNRHQIFTHSIIPIERERVRDNSTRMNWKSVWIRVSANNSINRYYFPWLLLLKDRKFNWVQQTRCVYAQCIAHIHTFENVHKDWPKVAIPFKVPWILHDDFA